MQAIATILFSLVLLGCNLENTRSTETLTGLVTEKRADTKSYEAWNAPSDPYYTLEQNGRTTTLRPSPSITTDQLASLRNKRVVLEGYHTEGKPYQPTEEIEQYPVEPVLDDAQTRGKLESVKMRPANRGRGFVVTEILEIR